VTILKASLGLGILGEETPLESYSPFRYGESSGNSGSTLPEPFVPELRLTGS